MKNLRSHTVCAVCSILMLVAGCRHEDLLMPSTTPSPLAHRGVAALVEITIRDIGKPTMRAEALVGNSMAELNVLRAERALHGGGDWKASFDLTVPENQGGVLGNATIQIDPTAAAALTVNGQRYFNANFLVRNAQKTDSVAFNTPRTNLTFVPVSTDSPLTLLDSPVLVWDRDGTQVNTASVRQLKPTGLVTSNGNGNVVSVGPDVLQVLAEEELEQIDLPAGVTNIFPYGFMTKLASNVAAPRVLPPNPAPNQFAGVMQIAFRLPLQENPADDPTTITLMMLALDDSQVRITQSLEEQTPAGQQSVQQRAASLGATQIRLLPGGSVPGQPASRTRLFCSVRTTGFADEPTSFLVNVGADFQALNPSPYANAGSFVSPTASLQATFSAPVQGAGPNNFIVRGLLSGQAFRSATYTTSGNVVTTPAGQFTPGEEVEVVVTTALSCRAPWVGRLRIKPLVANTSGTLASHAVPLAGDSPATIAIGDFNGDHNLDLAVANFGENTATILGGDGNGNFAVIGTTIVGSQPASIVTTDFNGDGILDLAVSNFSNNTVSVVLGNGNGTFNAATTFAVGGHPTQIETGDLNGDGVMDLVVDDAQSGDLSVLMGNGDGTFQPQKLVPTQQATRSLALGDLNEDGILDLVVASQGNIQVKALLGNGDGTFTPVNQPIQAGFVDAFYTALGDLNGDGHLDAVTVTNGAQGVTVMLGNGDGTFQEPHTYDLGGLPGNSVAIGDMNGDGFLDLIAVAQSGNAGEIVALPGLGNGTFPSYNSFPTTVANPSFVAVGALTRSGILDAVVGNAHNGAHNFGLFLGQP
jgi:hypothetical protein